MAILQCLSKNQIFKQKNFQNADTFLLYHDDLYTHDEYIINGLIPSKEYFPHKILSGFGERRVKITWRFPLTRGMGAAEARQSFAVANKEGFPSLFSPLRGRNVLEANQRWRLEEGRAEL